MTRPGIVPISFQQGPINNASLSVGQQVVIAAKSKLGLPYAWGGGDASGPTLGIHDGGVADQFGDYLKTGFDCSGLALYAWAQVGVHTLTHQTKEQYAETARVDQAQAQAGDLIFFTNNGNASGIHHVQIYGGDGTVIEAPYSGQVVRQVPVNWSNPELIGLGRPSGGTVGPNTGGTNNAGTPPTTVGSLTGISTRAWIVIGAIAVVGFVIVMSQV
jgi:cell wall-associated NlpC family hydrolase